MKDNYFTKAVAVWPKDLSDVMNVTVVFTAEIDNLSNQKAFLRIAGAQAYRICVNGVFAGYGPARAPAGFARVDEWPLVDGGRDGRNVVTIEVVLYRCKNFYLPNVPGFLQAEIIGESGDVLASTPDGFRATLAPRVRKTSRYTCQRGFTEAWHFTDGGSVAPYGMDESLVLVPSEYGKNVILLERRVAYPDFSIRDQFVPLCEVEHNHDFSNTDLPKFACWLKEGANFHSYPADEVEEELVFEWHQIRTKVARKYSEEGQKGVKEISSMQGVLFDGGVNDTGFIRAKVVVTEAPARIMAYFDEVVGKEGLIDVEHHGGVNCVVWKFSEPGEYEIESFEPYTFRYIEFFSTKGKVILEKVTTRGYRCGGIVLQNPDLKDAALNRIFDAARLTFATNAVDVFTDCPGRERAGWLCDSYFTARASWLFTKTNAHESLFLENFAVPKSFELLPEGMLPMCWPADGPFATFIPNWAMWFVLQLEEYAFVRNGDKELIAQLRDRVYGLIRYFEQFENEDGLLESLPGWNFIEWSMANDLTDGVNYPTNMTWAGVLEAVAHLYGEDAFRAKAKKIREKIREQSFDGRWFRDHAKRGEDGKLVVCDDRTETCQYYAFYFHTATKELYPELWRILSKEFGPKRTETGRYPDIYPANAFIGNYLRMDLLAQEGNREQILDETRGYFQYMAEQTGTLWENIGSNASCCHGFASYIAVVLAGLTD